MFETDEMIIFGLIGETGVGKSHLIHRYIKNSLP
jgi:GTPase SAR1 family protein